ncbi:MAG: ATP-binding protein [Polyangiales bacterium]
MNEVSGNSLGLSIQAAAQHGLPVEAIFEGLSIAPDAIPERVDWDTFRTVNERLGRLCGDRVPLDELGALLFTVPRMQRVLAAVQLVASPRMLFWAGHMWATPSAFRPVDCTFEDLDGGRVRLGARIREPYPDSPEFFAITRGVYRALPRLLGLPDAQVSLELQPRAAVYTVDLPPSLTLWSRLRRAAMLVLAPRAVLAELRDQNEQLRARFDELAIAHQEADRLRRDAEHARDVAEAALRVKSEFLATVSHELRTPLNGILGVADLLLGSPLGPEQREHAETILASGNTLLGLIGDVLDFSKIDAGKVDLARAAFDPRALLADVTRGLEATARAKGLSLATSGDRALPPLAVGDRERVRQVLANLVANALKFTEHGGVSVEGSIARREAGAPLLRFTVRDTGIGIARTSVARIFDPFTQVDASPRRRFGGTGLGLAICKQLVAQMGGDIGVDTEPGRGSTFWFTVPVELPAEGAPPGPEAHAAPPVGPRLVPSPPVSLRPRSLRPASLRPRVSGPRTLRPRAGRAEEGDGARPWVLLVDDNPVNLKVAAQALKRLEYNVATATDGARALEVFATRPFVAVLMDCQMPVMDGYEATAHIRDREAGGKRHTPVIAITANAMDGDRERCLASGMDDYIAKPVRLDVLRETLSRWAAPAVTCLPARPTSVAPAAG